MLDSLQKIKIDALEELSKANDLSEVEEIRIKYLGKRSFNPTPSRHGKLKEEEAGCR